jgi:hypothetical protein
VPKRSRDSICLLSSEAPNRNLSILAFTRPNDAQLSLFPKSIWLVDVPFLNRCSFASMRYFGCSTRARKRGTKNRLCECPSEPTLRGTILMQRTRSTHNRYIQRHPSVSGFHHYIIASHAAFAAPKLPCPSSRTSVLPSMRIG